MRLRRGQRGHRCDAWVRQKCRAREAAPARRRMACSLAAPGVVRNAPTAVVEEREEKRATHMNTLVAAAVDAGGTLETCQAATAWTRLVTAVLAMLVLFSAAAAASVRYHPRAVRAAAASQSNVVASTGNRADLKVVLHPATLAVMAPLPLKKVRRLGGGHTLVCGADRVGLARSCWL